MAATDEPTLDIDTRKKQLLDLSKNLNILLEREAKFGGNAPLELLNQIDDHRRAIDLIQQVLGGDLTGDELDEALKPLLLALHDGQVINITAETYVAGDLIQNITHILSAAEEAAQAQEIATRRLAEGVRDYLHRLQYIITAEPETEAQRLAQPTFENALDAAVALAGKGDSEATKTKFEEAMELAGSLNSAEGWHSLCVAGTRHGFAEMVLAACDEAIKLDEENGLYYNSRGIALLQVGKLKEAQENFARFEAWLEKR